MQESFLEIDINVLMNNLNIIKSEMSNVFIMGIVKGNAYGHGIINIAKELENKVEYLGVGLEYEAIKLRENGIKSPVLILSPYFNPENIIKYDITPSIDNIDDLKKLSLYANENNKACKFHLKINTGMNRFGLNPKDIDKFIDEYLLSPNVILEGMFSHFAISIDRDRKFVNKQLGIFKNCIDKFNQKNIEIKYCHMANSTAAFQIPDARFNMVRIGNALYGKVGKNKGIKAVSSLKSKIIDIREIKKGEYVGYGLGYKAKNDIRVGIIPIGFSDGYEVIRESKSYTIKETIINMLKVFYRYRRPRKLVYINGKPLDTVGKTNMQFIFVDITNNNDINLDSIVEIKVPSFYVSEDIKRIYKPIEK